MKTIILFLLFCFLQQLVFGQDPEFPKKEFIMHLRLHSGMVTDFNSSPELYVGGLQLVPQYTVVENHLRAGAVIGGFYTGKKIQALFGPTVSLKLKSFALKNLGSGGNLNLSVDHLWGTGKQRLIGAGINADLLNLMVIGLSAHRDYKLKNWWLQATVALRISKLKKIPHP